MVIPAVDKTRAVVFVVEPACDPCDRRPSDDLFAVGRPRVVHDSFRIGDDVADESNPASVGGPNRVGGAFRERAQLLWLAPGKADHEELIHGADLAQEGESASVGRPLRRMVSTRGARRLDGLGLEQPAMHHAASVLARVSIGPGKLVGDTLAVAAQPYVVDPTKTIKVFRANRPGHGVPPMLSARPYRLAVKHLR